MLIANGLPKSGTHALMSWLLAIGLTRHKGRITDSPPTIRPWAWGTAGLTLEELAAFPNSVFIHGHVAPSPDLDRFMVVTIIRDPRNVLVSYRRHRLREEGLEVSLVDAMRDYWGWGCFAAFYRAFLEWQGRATIVRYEDLEKCHPVARGSHTGVPSCWQDVWTDEAEEEWQRRDGPQLLRDAGYSSGFLKVYPRREAVAAA